MKNYLIIGGSSGIGAAVTDILSKNNNAIFATYNSNSNNPDTELIKYHHLDVLDSAFDFDFLPEILDGMVYCPGSINLKPFSRIKPDDFLTDFNLQVNGAISVLQKVLPRLKKSELASVIMFSTVAVQNGFNFHSQVAASKGAIEGLTRSLAAEFAPKIRFNAIAPSLTDTKLASKLLSSEEKKEVNAERHPMKKIGSAQDIAEMAVFLLSDKAKWITGQIIHVDGGMSTIKN
ncbi:SDR family NAD(P)-dependent oxidoreductase [Brumimicrobium mesophilum]|uniref:SDR family NAD(P)-dependent oxidoreductase n=1 Tax=Brumimicrobium mesophilum TaxID=392717 RepID=UPI000D13EEAD|nr:SDR family oxidoreductase [Brumimicrobium mesophilum]